MTRRTRTRRGMTLVELLVAAAMSIMVMWLLTWCYQQGLGSFSSTKSQGDLMDQLRQVSSLMTRDLTASHFEPDDNRPNLGLRVSDQGVVGGTGYTPPHGYFTATSLSSTLDEGVDGYNFHSSYSVNHTLQFTAVLPGGPPQYLFCADLTGATGSTPPAYYGRAAEIAYFLDTANPVGRTAGGTPLYNLKRRQRVCGINSDDAASYDLSGAPASASDVMTTTGSAPKWTVLPLRQLSLTTPTNNRLNTSIALNTTRYGEDILMSNVVSLEIKFTGPQSGNWPASFPVNTDYPYDNLTPLTNGTFDTGSTGLPAAQQIRITGAMIRIRAYAPRTQITRQTTFIVPL